MTLTEVIVDGSPPRRVRLSERPVGWGGQGRVFSVPEDPGLAIKVYVDPPASIERRLRRMIERAGPDAFVTGGAHPELVWPLALALDPSGDRVVGYAMRLVSSPAFVPLATLFDHRQRVRWFPDMTWRFPLVATRNFSGVVANLHAEGLVLGDLSDGNVMVNQSALLTFLDCDSIQFDDRVTGEHFACTVGTPNYAAPEFQFNDAWPRSIDTDVFSLAILVCQTALLGDHAFLGIGVDAGENEVSVADNIREGRSYLVAPDRVRTPPGTLDPAILPPDVRALAVQAFGPGIATPSLRPSAEDWALALDRACQSLVQCPREPLHVHGPHLDRCPWCERTRNGLPDPFAKPRTDRTTTSRPLAPASSTAIAKRSSVSPATIALTVLIVVIVIALLL
ncbi:hypothetical protein [Solirubrobacter soli]|uniref:hypothetical protein n=1 Tax=Solirubrobacter soli TaxID=363832 RepID=UPI00040E55C8|nr:hypothetical protein [Solirubrobacter soli]